MRFLTDENMPRGVIRHLRETGHDVLAAREELRGANDAVILARPQSEVRILLTQDKDFGELAFRFGLPSGCGVVLFRLSGRQPADDEHRIVESLGIRTDWAGSFSVVEEGRIRMRPLPMQRP